MICVLLGAGFEELEVVSVCDILRRGGVDVKLIGVDSMEVTGGHGITLKADMLVNEIDIMEVEMVVVPGGLGGVEAIEENTIAMELVHTVFGFGGEVAAICAGPRVLGRLGILQDRSAVCFPGMEDQMYCEDMRPDENIVKCGRVTTGKAPGTAMEFGFALLEIIKGHEIAEMIADAMCYNS